MGERWVVEVDAHFEDGVACYAQIAPDWGHFGSATRGVGREIVVVFNG